MKSRYKFRTLLLVLFPNNLPLDEVETLCLTGPWTRGPGVSLIFYRLLISQTQQRQPVKLTCAIPKNAISFPGPDHAETHTGHLVFCFNLISPPLVSGNLQQQQTRGPERVVSHGKSLPGFSAHTTLGVRCSFAGRESVKLYSKIKKKIN